ncbi:uncharacterized protein [Rutidosis leptorrhynchoides]|uniref:uncharacterized protein n=1 Tax=Rutidosis leptorrhynchoides TaxID=125765 RepID=UPI003A99FF6E
MLNKRFKIAKCKTSLKLATARINIMRNKKVVQINQMKKEIAQLLDSGQDRTARIRVEHVIREEKMVAAYDLIEIYCELIVARLPIIESQKTCPIDLKEAVTSVIFAAPRCSDITELADVRKNFKAKYGTEFVTAALELRPDCGVNRMLVEKLSAVAPDVQTKMKTLTTIAKEHNISWDPTSVEETESKPPNDLLNGPTNFEKLSTINVDPPEIQTSNVYNVHNHDVNPNVPIDFSQQNKRFTLDSQNTSSPITSGIKTSSASSNHDDMRPSGLPMNMRQSFHTNEKDSWNMEFKDATSAAQAAAESAERASYAARAAAQLSRQYSSESQNSHIRDEKPQLSEFSGQRHFKDSYNTSFNDQNPKINNQQVGSSNNTPLKVTKKSSSSRSQNDSVNERSRNNFQRADEYHDPHEDQGFYYYSETSSKNESVGRLNSGKIERSFKSSNNDHHEKDVIRRLPPATPSRSHSSTGQRTAIDQQKLFTETTNISSYGNAHRDDETDSDSDADNHPRFDTGFDYDEEDAKLFFPSPGREDIRPLETINISTPKKNFAKSADLFDDRDSENESEVEKSGFSGTEKFISPRKHDQDPAYVEPSLKENSIRSRIELTDLIENESEMVKKFPSPRKMDVFSIHQEPARIVEQLPNDNSRKARIELNDLIDIDNESEHEIRKSHMVKKASSFYNTKENSDYLKQSDELDTGNDIKFGTLKGGHRNNAGVKYPPYLQTASSTSSKNSVEESPLKVDPTSKQSSFNSRESKLDKKKPSLSMSSSESDSDDYSDKFSRKLSKPKSLFAPPATFFDSDSEEEIPTRLSTGKTPLVSGVSRRTKGQIEPKAKTFISKQSPTEPPKFEKNPDINLESSETSSTSAYSKFSRRAEPRPHKVHSKQESFGKMHVPKLSEDQPKSPPKRIVQSGKNEESKTTDVTSKASVAENNNVKKPSHVHPKLPDFESLAARMQALRSDHK